jgi:hypothetical protein
VQFLKDTLKTVLGIGLLVAAVLVLLFIATLFLYKAP